MHLMRNCRPSVPYFLYPLLHNAKVLTGLPPISTCVIFQRRLNRQLS